MSNNYEIIAKILVDELSRIYCYNCKYNRIDEETAMEKYSNWGCEDCHRKYMGWELSEEKAQEIAKKIIEADKELEQNKN